MEENRLINKQLAHIFDILGAHYGESILRTGWRGNKSWWQAKSALELMVGSILVQNTNWKNVDQALGRFSTPISPQFFLTVSLEEIAEVIRPAGFQNQKAQKLKALFEWFSTYSFDINQVTSKNKEVLRKELLAIHGIGNETADAMLVYVFNKASFVIDAYARRIFTRIGFAVPKSYTAFQQMIENAILCDVPTYDYYHGLIVEHAKDYCTKIPKCDHCPLVTYCNKNI